MLSVVVDILSWASFIVGGFFLFVGSLGMVRLVDFWARLHAAAIIDSAGVGLILFGMMLQGGLTLITAKLVLIVLFLFITGPTASHAVANAAFMSGSRPHDLVEDVTADPPVAKKKAAAARTTKSKAASKTTKAKTTKASSAASKAKTTKTTRARSKPKAPAKAPTKTSTKTGKKS